MEITKQLNSSKVPTFGRSYGWNVSYVQKILESEAVIGRFQPMRIDTVGGKRRRLPVGDPIEDYFPAIISKSDWLKVREIRENRKIGQGKKGNLFSNLYAGLLKCSCGGNMHYINKGRTSRGRLYLSCARFVQGAGCDNKGWKYPIVEWAIFFSLINEIDTRGIFPKVFKSGEDELKKLDDLIILKKDELGPVDIH